MREEFASLFTKENLEISAGVMAALAILEFSVAGWVMDIILLGAGALVIGSGAFKAANELAEFVSVAKNAESAGDLEVAANHLARAIIILGVTTFMAFIFRAGARARLRNVGPESELKVLALPARGGPSALSGGEDVVIYRGISKNVASAAKLIIREGDVNRGIFSTDFDAANNAVAHYAKVECMDPPFNGTGIVRVKVPAKLWDMLVRTNNISERPYTGYSPSTNPIASTEIVVHSDEAAKILNALPNEIIPFKGSP